MFASIFIRITICCEATSDFYLMLPEITDYLPQIIVEVKPIIGCGCGCGCGNCKIACPLASNSYYCYYITRTMTEMTYVFVHSHKRHTQDICIIYSDLR